jgi:hypothetical protein
MVRALARGFSILCLVLPLASCIFFFSAFPPILTQVVARTDLSSMIPAANAKDYDIYCVTASDPPPNRFVILMNRNASNEPRVIVMDSSLKLIQSYSMVQLTNWALPGAFSGSGIMVDAAGHIEIGNLGFSAGNLLTVGTNSSWNGNGAVQGPSWGSLLLQCNDINFMVSGGNSLTYTQYQPWWSFDFFSVSLPLKSTADTQFQVQGVYNTNDPSAASTVILVLEEQNNPTVHFVAIPRDDFFNHAGSIPAVLTPIFDNYPHASYSQVETSSIGFAGDCMVAYSYQKHALVRYSLTPPFGVISELPIGQSMHQITYGYEADGSYSVQMDQSTRMLTKVAKWW